MYSKPIESFIYQRRYIAGPGKKHTSHVPFGYSSFGKRYPETSPSIVCNLTSNYRKRVSTEWAPIQLDRPNPPLIIGSTGIYSKHIGQVPHYGGHIPGAMFRFGQTYGNDSRDAKRWLRGDLNNY